MKSTFLTYLVACMLAAGVPLLSRSGLWGPASVSQPTEAFPGWPTLFQGKPLTQVQMLPREQRFYRDFDGHIARFTDGERQIVIRWIASNNRQFHLTTRCFRAIGYRLSPLPAHKDSSGKIWGVFRAERGDEVLEVRERIVDNAHRTWTDESAWRWDIFRRRTKGPWWAYTVAARSGGSSPGKGIPPKQSD